MGRVGGYLSEEPKVWFVKKPVSYFWTHYNVFIHQNPESHIISAVGIGEMHAEHGATVEGSRATA